MNTEQSLVAFRELVEAGEAAGWDVTENKHILQAGRDAYAAIVAAYAQDCAALREPLQLCAGALQAAGLHGDRKVTFTGRWKHFGTTTVAAILDRASAALGTERTNA